MDPVDIGLGVARIERAGAGPLVILDHALGPLVWGWPLHGVEGHCTIVAVAGFEDSSGRTRPLVATGALTALVHALGFDRFTLCSWSMAAPAAARYAVEEQRELERLVLVDPAGLSSPPPNQHSELFDAAETDDPIRAWVDMAWDSWVHRADLDTTVFRQRTYELLTARPGAFKRNLQANRGAVEAPLMTELAPLQVPTLVMTGRWSSVLGPDAAADFVGRLPNGRLEVFEESAHAIPLEEPDHFQDSLTSFVAESLTA